jgi:putative transposase
LGASAYRLAEAAPREDWPQSRTEVAAIIDSQSIKTSAVRGDERGDDGGKKVLGRKRHLLVDTQGFLLAVKVHAANILDRHGAPLLLAPLVGHFPPLQLIWADSGYNGKCKAWIKEHLGVEVEIVNHPWTGLKGVWAPEGAEIDWDKIIPKGCACPSQKMGRGAHQRLDLALPPLSPRF